MYSKSFFIAGESSNAGREAVRGNAQYVVSAVNAAKLTEKEVRKSKFENYFLSYVWIPTTLLGVSQQAQKYMHRRMGAFQIFQKREAEALRKRGKSKHYFFDARKIL